MQRSQTLLRGLKLLELIASKGSGFSIRQLSDEIKLPRTIVHRLLSTLEDADYVQRKFPLPGYKLGTKLWSLGCLAIEELEISEVAHPYLENLASVTKELVNIAILDGRQVVYIDKVDCSQSVRAHIPIGGRAPAYYVATGQAILAHIGDKEVNKIVSLGSKLNTKTARSSNPLNDNLAQIRKRGYSVSLGTYRKDVGGVAAPIYNKNGNPVAAVGITFPLNRVTSKHILEFGRLTVGTAASISRKLGYTDTRLKRTSLVATRSNMKLAMGEK